MQIHVDPVGGWSGDMFVAALLDAFPSLWPDVQAAIAALRLGPEAEARLVGHSDGVLTGRRFLVAAEPGKPEPAPHHDPRGTHAHHHDDPHDHHHHHAGGGLGHRAWSDIRNHLQEAPLPPDVRSHAIGIFGLLAQAEAQVHGIAVDAVQFHEVGAVDSIVDIVSAAQLIAALKATRWTASPLPLGSGRVRTAHGILPVPAPATALLLRGLATTDDGVPGERVTPTGAAVARYLLDDQPAPVREARRLTVTGTGFGTRRLPGISNCLRVLAFEEVVGTGERAAGIAHRELGVINFEVDDQSAEDLAHGLDHIRSVSGVHDVIQSAVFGKKGRMATHVQVLAAPETLDAAVAACFEETTTIGLRFHVVRGAVLQRHFDDVEVDATPLRVKTVTRPSGGWTSKAEASDVATHAGHAARVALRRAGEDEALRRAASRAGETGEEG